MGIFAARKARNARELLATLSLDSLGSSIRSSAEFSGEGEYAEGVRRAAASILKDYEVAIGHYNKTITREGK